MNIIAHGVDLVEIRRISEMLLTHGDRFPRRCFTPGERAYADSTARRRAERYAARFAAKEAVLKTLGTGWREGITWCDVEVMRAASGQPSVRLTGRCADLAAEMGARRWYLSLSHSDSHALASVIACG